MGLNIVRYAPTESKNGLLQPQILNPSHMLLHAYCLDISSKKNP